jgi:excisionase family DNA binding protein
MRNVATHRLLRVQEAAAVLRCSRSSVYRRIDDGTLPAFRAGLENGPLLIRERDVDKLLRPARSETTP